MFSKWKESRVVVIFKAPPLSVFVGKSTTNYCSSPGDRTRLLPKIVLGLLGISPNVSSALWYIKFEYKRASERERESRDGRQKIEHNLNASGVGN